MSAGRGVGAAEGSRDGGADRVLAWVGCGVHFGRFVGSPGQSVP